MVEKKSTGRPVESPPMPVGDRLKAVLHIAYRARRPVLLEGPTGIGKSDVKEVATELGIRRIVLDLSLLEPPDLVGLPVTKEGRTKYAAPAILPTDGAGLLMLEELNRAERYIQQPALQLLTERRLHDYELPEGWSTCAAINPERQEYQVTAMDPALRSRFLNLKICADRESWLRWAEQNEVHQVVLQLGRLHDRLLEDTPPRTWTYVSDVLKALTPKERENQTLLSDLLGGYLTPPWIEMLLKVLPSCGQALAIDVNRLLRGHNEGVKLVEELVAFRKQGRTDVLEAVANRVQALVEGPELNALIGRNEFSIEAFEKLISELPGDRREILQVRFGKNPVTAQLIGLKPDDVLKSYQDSPAQQKVTRWNQDPFLQHRLCALVQGVCVNLRSAKQQNPELWRNAGLKAALGQFIADIKPEIAQRLTGVLKELDITPLAPSRRRGGTQ